MKLWEGLEQDLNYNTMVSQRGVLNLYHSDAQRDAYARRGNAMRMHGVDAELLDAEGVRRMMPFIDLTTRAFPYSADCCNAVVARHATMRSCGAMPAPRALLASTSSRTAKSRVSYAKASGSSVCRPRAARSAPARSGVAVAGNTSRLADMAGLRLPIESHVLQAFVSEAIKPFIDCVVTFGAGHFYISQSDKGGLVFGGDIDGYNSYAQRGNLPTVEDVCESGMALMPAMGRVRMLRSWGGIMDMTMDGSPIIDRTPIEGLYLNAGWCYGGFKATPASGWCFAHLAGTRTKRMPWRARIVSTASRPAI